MSITKRRLVLLAAIKNARPYAVVATQLKAMTGHSSNMRAIQRDLAELHDTGLIYSAQRCASNEYYWTLTDAGCAYFGLPVPKEQAT